MWWEALLACLKKPDDGGVTRSWTSGRTSTDGGTPQPRETADDPTAGLVTLHIDENLRNTKRIAQTFRGFSSNHFSPRGGDGLPVCLVACPTEDALDVASNCVDSLIDEGWAANQIALLHQQAPSDPSG